MTTIILPRLNQLQSGQVSGAGLVSKVDFTFPLSSTQFEDGFGNVITLGSVFIGSGLPSGPNFSMYSINTNAANVPLQYASGTLTAFSQFTVCCSFYMTSAPAGGAFYALAAQDSSTNGFAFLIGGTSGKLEAWTAAGSFSGTTATTVLAVNQPYHAAMSYDGTNRTVYLNGVQEVQAAASFTAVSSPALVIGGDATNTGRGLAGRIGDFRFYNRALAAEEISSIYLAGVDSEFPVSEELMPPMAVPVAAPVITFFPGWVHANTIVQGVAT